MQTPVLLLAFLALSMSGCLTQTVKPGVVGIFEGQLEKADQSGSVFLRLASQLQTYSSASYSFSGTAQLAQQAFTLSGTERGAGVVYQTPAPQGQVVAFLLEGSTSVYCLGGWAYYGQGTLNRLFLTLYSVGGKTSCTGDILARGELQKVP